jgi:CMP-N-acetylneuraminic acid synthetase
MKVGIILARGGSKGIINKNLQMIGETSLLEKSIKTMLISNIFSRIIVSSDSSKILNIAKECNVETHNRSEITSNDSSTSEEALFEVLADKGINNGTVFLIQCTTPFLNSQDLQNIDKQFPHGHNHTIITGYYENVHHWYMEKDKIKPIGESAELRSARQKQKTKIFVENGGAYVFDIASFLITRNRFLKEVDGYEMSKENSIDIDLPIDLKIARFLS